MRDFNENMKQYHLSDTLLKMNDKGLFDEYSEEHFLIKALNGNIDYFDKYNQLIKDSIYYSEGGYNATNFILNFSSKFQWFCDHFSEIEMDNFVKNQLSAGKKQYKEEQFFRAMAEINVLNFLMSFGPTYLKEAIYEPKLGVHGSNPEARLIYGNGITIDVEVKTPGFIKKINGDEKGVLIPTFLLENKDKINFEKQCNKNGFKFILPRVGKLKDYINSAGKKFEIPKDPNHINLLFINWTYTDVDRRGYLEPYSLLYNNLNGLLKNKEAALSIGVNEDALQKISAVIVYQDSFDSLIFGDFRYMWKGYNFRMLPNMLMDKELCDIDIIRDALRMNPPKKNDDMFPYEFVVREQFHDDSIKVAEYINRRIKAKIKGEDNFTYYNKKYYKKKIKEVRRKQRKYNELKQIGYIR